MTEATSRNLDAEIEPCVIPPGSRILVCGATGYVGGRLVPRLLEEGYRVRCFARSPQKLNAYRWRDAEGVEIAQGDLDDPDSIARAADGIDAAYYLVHSMITAGAAYDQRDRELAKNFGEQMKAANVSRVIYLGGLGETGAELSKHLRSRREVESVLRENGVPTTVLRAAMIIGSGSASFEILRYLVDRLPVMIVPRWVQTPTQPIAIRDVLRYLVGCLKVKETTGQTLDIGGPDVLTYREMMDLMCEEVGLRKRIIFELPILTPRLSSRWIGLVTPVTSKIARPLADGLKNPTVCRDNRAAELMPGPLFGVRVAIDAAIGKLAQGDIETRWSTAGELPGDPAWSGGTTFKDQRETIIDAPPERAFSAVCRIGGKHGYWGSDWLWHIRGWMDQLIGGPGLRRGRRHPEQTSFGEVIDFWRVSGYETNRLLQLRAEMWLPGEAELQFRFEPVDSQPGQTRLIQTARFRPRGLLGLVYWWSVWPLHFLVFPAMIRGVKRDSENQLTTDRLPAKLT